MGGTLIEHRPAVAVGLPTLAFAALLYLSMKFAWWPRLGQQQLRIALAVSGVAAAWMFYVGA
jgi:hypothetical protein